MQAVSALYNTIYSGNHATEFKLKFNNDNQLEYGMDYIITMKTNEEMFGSNSGDSPSVGNCVSSQIDITMRKVPGTIPKFSSIIPYFRVVNATQQSEWISKKTYFVYTREEENYPQTDVVEFTIHGYDSLIKADDHLYGATGDEALWPKTDIQAVNLICNKIGINVDQRTTALMTNAYSIQYPGFGEDAYTMREMLGYIASAYGGNFIISDSNTLLLVPVFAVPTSTHTDVPSSIPKVRPATTAYTKVVINVGSNETTGYEAGTDTGLTLEFDNPYGTQSMANNVLTLINNKTYKPFTIDEAVCNPAMEVGDGINISNIVYTIYSKGTDYSGLTIMDLEAPYSNEANQEFKVVDQSTAKLSKKVNKLETEFKIMPGQILSRVSGSQAEAYDETVGYSIGDNTIYNNKYYRALYNISAPAGAFDASKWEEISALDIADSMIDVSLDGISLSFSQSGGKTILNVCKDGVIISGGSVQYQDTTEALAAALLSATYGITHTTITGTSITSPHIIGGDFTAVGQNAVAITQMSNNGLNVGVTNNGTTKNIVGITHDDVTASGVTTPYPVIILGAGSDEQGTNRAVLKKFGSFYDASTQTTYGNSVYLGSSDVLNSSTPLVSGADGFLADFDNGAVYKIVNGYISEIGSGTFG